jgi:hypothetical protein
MVMASVRTRRVLGALFVSMTVGALILMMMESDPPRPDRLALANLQSRVIGQSDAITRPWRRIVVHASPGGPDTLPRRCHFIVDAFSPEQTQWVRATGLWRRQQPGRHVFLPGGDFNTEAIGICVMGEFSVQPPSQAQFDALMTLVRELQKRCEIPADSVYLYDELFPESRLPGEKFPTDEFNRRLYRQEE